MMGQALGCIALVAIVAVPVWLQSNGYSPFWVLPLAFLFNIFWLPHEHRAKLEAAVAENGGNVRYQTLVKPLFWATWFAMGIYAASYAINRWVL